MYLVEITWNTDRMLPTEAYVVEDWFTDPTGDFLRLVSMKPRKTFLIPMRSIREVEITHDYEH